LSAVPDGAVSPRAVPTLTEVVQPAPSASIDDSAPALDEARLVEQVLARLQQQIDPLLAAQVQAAMAPALAQAMERLLHETRLALARSLREQVAGLVAEAVASASIPAPPQRGTGLAG
jgi:hypothetical protein